MKREEGKCGDDGDEDVEEEREYGLSKEEKRRSWFMR